MGLNLMRNICCSKYIQPLPGLGAADYLCPWVSPTAIQIKALWALKRLLIENGIEFDEEYLL